MYQLCAMKISHDYLLSRLQTKLHAQAEDVFLCRAEQWRSQAKVIATFAK